MDRCLFSALFSYKISPYSSFKHDLNIFRAKNFFVKEKQNMPLDFQWNIVTLLQNLCILQVQAFVKRLRITKK